MSYIIDSYSESNYVDWYVQFSETARKYFYQSFTGDGGTLNSAKWYLEKSSTGSPTGNVYAKIYAHTGTYGTSSEPTGSVLATSDAVDVSTINTSYELVTFTFSGGDKITLTNGTHYCLIVEWVWDSGILNVGFDGNSPTHDGNEGTKYNETIYSGDDDFIFYVYGDEMSSDIKKISGVAQASIKEFIGVTNVNIKKIIGVDN